MNKDCILYILVVIAVVTTCSLVKVMATEELLVSTQKQDSIRLNYIYETIKQANDVLVTN